MSTYVFDLDHTLCDTKRSYDKSGKGTWEYYESTPYEERIEVVNNLIKEVDFCINQLSDFENQNE